MVADYSVTKIINRKKTLLKIINYADYYLVAKLSIVLLNGVVTPNHVGVVQIDLNTMKAMFLSIFNIAVIDHYKLWHCKNSQ